MAIIINDPYARGGGAEAGKQFGDILSTGLQQLAQTKMQNMQKRQEVGKLMPLVGGNSQLANLLAGNPKLQQEYFKQQWQRPNMENYSNALQEAATGQAVQQPEQVTQEVSSPIQPQAIQKIPSEEKPFTQMPLLDYLRSSGLNAEKALGEMQPRTSTQQIPQQDLRGFKPHEVAEITKIGMKRKQIEAADIRSRHQATQKINDKIISNSDKAIKQLHTYESLFDRAKNNQLYSGPFRQMLEKFGLQNMWTNAATQASAADIETLAQDAAAAFDTARLTNFEANAYKNSLVKLSNTREGIMVIAKNKMLETQAPQLKNKIRQEILKENNGVPPYNLNDQINERLDPILNNLAQMTQDNADIAINDIALADASEYSPDTVIKFNNQEYRPQGKYWVRI